MPQTKIDPENEEKLMEVLADALCAEGFRASSQDTGGGIVCVVLDRAGEGEIVWGLADVNWGASVTGEDGEVISGIETDCPGDTDDLAKIVAALKKPSIDNGAIYKAP
jgi:hypothetical protein